MALPFFYTDSTASIDSITLDEETSKHIVSVLRMQIGEQLHLTDGKGLLVTAAITDNHKKRCVVKMIDATITPVSNRKVTIAVSLVKNNTRFEWLLEKGTELGIASIIPLLCERTERQHFRHDRMKGVIVSAMLQSQQCWLPELYEPQSYSQVIKDAKQEQKFIAHCIDSEKQELASLINSNLSSQIILIGPEGDFTNEEIDLALKNQFTPVSLGTTRLRTETAALAAAVLLKVGN